MLNLGGNLSPEQQIEQQQIARQQRMAELLMQQGQSMPSGQMVSGRYVAPNFFQYAAPLLQSYLGKKELSKVEQRQLDMAKELREQGKLETERLMNVFGGRPEVAGTPDIPTETYETVRGTPAQAAIPANPKLAYAEAINMTSPQARALLPFLAAEAFKKPKWEKAEYTDEKTGKTRQGVYDANSPDPISTFQVGGVKPEMTAYERASLNMRGAELNFQGIPVGGVGGGNVAPAQPSKDKFAPAIQPQYQYNPSISPKLNQEAAAKFAETLTKNETNAKDSFDLMKAASNLLSSEAPSSGRLSNIATGTGEIFGISSAASKADSRLNLLSGALTMKQPRFEGPQGVLDVTLYQKLAGDLGNPNIPIATRLGNIEEMINLQKKYYPQGDWDSISTKTQGEAKTDAVKSAGKVSLRAPQYATNPKTGERIVSTDGGINWKPVGNK